MSRRQHDYEKFITTWQTSKTRHEVARKLKLTLNQIGNLHVYLSRRGVKLKKMRHIRHAIDFEKLARLAIEMAPRRPFNDPK